MCKEWIPRDENQKADDLSSCGDSDNWYVSNEVFSELNLKWGPHTIDHFASMHNAKLKRFNSRFWLPGTEVEIVWPKFGQVKLIGGYHLQGLF